MNISTDSLAFIDDNPYERYEVSTYLPEVNVYEADDTAELPELPEFQFVISEETSKRRQQMMSRWVRNTFRKESTSISDK